MCGWSGGLNMAHSRFAVSVASVLISHFGLACAVLGVAVIGVFRTHF